MRRLKRNHALLSLIGLLLVGTTSPATAITTSQGQAWDYEPDAWTRGSDANTSYFGWDRFEPSGASLDFGKVLDDATPDLGVAASNARIYQGADGASDPAPTTYGHVSGSGNLYSGFRNTSVLDMTVAGLAPAGGAGGFTTLVLQLIGGAPQANSQDGNSIADLTFDLPGWTKVKDLYGVESTGTGVYWQEWTAAGAGLPFSIDIDSPAGTSDFAIDAIQVDAFWTSGTAPAINSLSAIGVPEPSTLALASLLSVGLLRMRRRRVAS